MFWANKDARETLREVKAFGVSAGQLGFPGEFALDGKAAQWKEAIANEDFAITTAVCSYVGENYADIPTVLRTVGLVPASTRDERVNRTKAVAAAANEIGIKNVACHIGFVPHDPADPLYNEMRAVARDICDYCARSSQNFTLETGQEPAAVLLRFIGDVGRPNLKINFDPANMILYGSGDPIEALKSLAAHVLSVHCKDGDWPPKGDRNTLGKERALGEGSVGIPKFIETLKEIGYRDLLCIEREESNLIQRGKDIGKAVALLRSLTAVR
jgi:sugar phosphate isomerase/epimerase